MRPTFVALFVVLFVVVAALAPMTREASAAQGPRLTTPVAKLRAALHCPSSFRRKGHEPVLLVPGTGTNGEMNYSWTYVPALRAIGIDACTVDLPDYALDDMQVASEYVVYGIRSISSRTRTKVNVLGVSQGAVEPRWAVKWWPDVRREVDDLVMMAGPHHGVAGYPPSGFMCIPACWQMAKGSHFLAALNRGDETPGSISYTSVYTQFDELVEPNSTSVLAGARNILLQSICPGRPTEHLAISTSDAVAYAIAVDAFTHKGPADPARIDKSVCTQSAMPHTDYAAAFNAFLDTMRSGKAPNPQWTTSEPKLASYAGTG